MNIKIIRLIQLKQWDPAVRKWYAVTNWDYFLNDDTPPPYLRGL